MVEEQLKSPPLAGHQSYKQHVSMYGTGDYVGVIGELPAREISSHDRHQRPQQMQACREGCSGWTTRFPGTRGRQRTFMTEIDIRIHHRVSTVTPRTLLQSSRRYPSEICAINIDRILVRR